MSMAGHLAALCAVALLQRNRIESRVRAAPGVFADEK
jgi:hypothetical protein